MELPRAWYGGDAAGGLDVRIARVVREGAKASTWCRPPPQPAGAGALAASRGQCAGTRCGKLKTRRRASPQGRRRRYRPPPRRGRRHAPARPRPTSARSSKRRRRHRPPRAPRGSSREADPSPPPLPPRPALVDEVPTDTLPPEPPLRRTSLVTAPATVLPRPDAPTVDTPSAELRMTVDADGLATVRISDAAAPPTAPTAAAASEEEVGEEAEEEAEEEAAAAGVDEAATAPPAVGAPSATTGDVGDDPPLTPRAPAVTLHLTKAAERRARAVKRGEQRRVKATRREHDLQRQRRDAALESIERTTASLKSRHASIEDAANPRPLPARTFAVRLAERRRLATDAEPLMAAAALFAAEAAAEAASEAGRRRCVSRCLAGGRRRPRTVLWRPRAAALAARAPAADERWRAAARALPVWRPTPRRRRHCCTRGLLRVALHRGRLAARYCRLTRAVARRRRRGPDNDDRPPPIVAAAPALPPAAAARAAHGLAAACEPGRNSFGSSARTNFH